MNDLVFLSPDSVQGEPFTTSDVVAQYSKNEHESIIRLLAEYQADFEEFGPLTFSDLKSGNSKGGRPQKICLLNEQQAMLLITYLKNTGPVRAFKKELVRQFYAMRLELFKRRSEREALKPVTKDMAQRIHDCLPDSPHKNRQYGNFINLSYRLAVGRNAKAIRQERGAAPKAVAADFLTGDEYRALQTVQGQIATLLELGMGYSEIKDVMINRPVMARAG